MKILHQYTNGNAKITLWEDGTKETEWPDNEPLMVEYPTSCDLKLTNNCNMDKVCLYCHEQSNPAGKHGDLDFMGKIFESALPGMEIACLSGETRVATPLGMRKISELRIGDLVYDSVGNEIPIVNIKQSNKPPIKLSLNKGIHFVASEDHPFMVNTIQQEAKTLKNKFLDIANMVKWNGQNKKIDMADYITVSQKKQGRSGVIFDQLVKVNHVSVPATRYISPDNELMWLYGLVVAEGFKRGIALHKDEVDLADRAIKMYNTFFPKPCQSNKRYAKNGLVVEFCHSAYYERLFFDAMQIGRGARNKSIKFLFGLDKELIRSALFGMFQGDGCFRKRNDSRNKKYVAFSLSYKTTSETLAKELVFLLSAVFDVQSSIYHGWSPKRQIEGRTIERTDYYKIDIYGKNNIKKLFNIFDADPDFNKEIEDFRLISQKYYVKNIEETYPEPLYDIQLIEDSSHLFVIDGGIVTHNCGGGDTLSHPDIEKFLRKVTDIGCVPNITINSLHIKNQAQQIRDYQNDKLVYGVGVSYRGKNSLKQMPMNIIYDHVVFHMILGLHTFDDVMSVYNWCNDNSIRPKILMLGYKSFGNGTSYLENNPWLKDHLIQWQKFDLRKMLRLSNVTLSFDNLAIEQLELQKAMDPKQWDLFYQGNDGTTTFYMDSVTQICARTSTSSVRFELNETDKMKDVFAKVRI